MAIAVIGGLIISTLLSLIFVPSFFTLMDDVGRLCSRLSSRFITGHTALAQPGENDDGRGTHGAGEHDSNSPDAGPKPGEPKPPQEPPPAAPSGAKAAPAE